MGSLTIGEIEALAARLRSLSGARLQKVYSSHRDLVLEFYGSGQEFWLWWDLQPAAPVVVLLEANPPQLPRAKKPVALFIHSHGVNRHLAGAERPQGQGRVLRLYLGAVDTGWEDCCQIEGRVFPHGQNILAKEGQKFVWWRKPQPLPEAKFEELVEAGRTLEEVANQWRTERVRAHSFKSPNEVDKKLKQEIARRERAIRQIKQDLERYREVQWRQLGEWLSANQTLEVPQQWQKMVDGNESFSWNLERCFQTAKALEAKRGGTKQRLSRLQEELSRLQSKGLAAFEIQRPGVMSPLQKGVKQEIKTRKLELDDKFVAYVGRSAKDNLKLLRQARAWDLWLHLRDYPGSHCIIRRNKKEVVPEVALKKAAQWMARVTFGKKAGQKKGEKLTLVSAECRYVQPIKGDKIGRVNFRNELTLTLLFTP